MTTLMTIESVTKRFTTARGEATAVDDANLEIHAGTVTCLVGESGSGKTTIARIAAGLETPSEGTVTYGGRNIAGYRGKERHQLRRAVQYIHQDPYASLNPTRTVSSTLRSAMTRSERSWERALELLELVELTPAQRFLDLYPHQLSGGQRQRVVLARALCADPQLLIADEPTSMLDVSVRGNMLKILARLRDEFGVGFLFITHDFTLARHFAWEGSTSVMHLGKIVEQGPTKAVLGNPQHEYTRALIDALPQIDLAKLTAGTSTPGVHAVSVTGFGPNQGGGR
ncbi:ABC transporter ATP-binding protein [Brachybacterium sp. AOP42-E1-35]|uniref:ABC transporter ATP-binding protein n=1 Tax=Brachybacterium sp. AOP42-E1-35 TaxID=3457664 RepID=UPI00402AC977